MKKELWHADIYIDIALAKSCVESQFPSLCPVFDIQCIDEGWDNVVFLVGNKIIFRFPRREIAIDLINRENQLLPNLKNIFNIDIPYPQYIGQPSSQFPYPFQGYVQLIGNTTSEVPLSTADRIKSIKPLALFLKKLHMIDKDQAYQLGARAPVFDRTRKQKMFADLQARINKIKQKNIVLLDDDKVSELFALAENADLSQAEHCLIHGDLYFRHLLFNEGQLTGVIDWGDTAINHPAIDLGVIHSFYPQHCHQEFFKYYGEVDKDTWDYAKFLGLYSALTIMLYAYDRGEVALVEEAKVGLEFVMG